MYVDQATSSKFPTLNSALEAPLIFFCHEIYFQLLVTSDNSGMAQLQFMDVHKFSFTPAFPYVNLLRKW